MAILIISKREGFRRAGVEHSETPTIYADDRFTRQQVAALKAEPMLIVREVDAEEPAGIPAKPWDSMTVAELKAYAAAKQIDLGGASKKDDILAAIAVAEADAGDAQ